MVELDSYWTKILNAPLALTSLIKGLNIVKETLRGYPENIKSVNGDTATIYFKGLDYPTDLPMSGRNRPEFIESVIGLISKGTKQEVHDAILLNSVSILNNFEYDSNWHKLVYNGNETVRNTEITGFNIYPERTGNSLRTTAIITLKHDVRFRR